MTNSLVQNGARTAARTAHWSFGSNWTFAYDVTRNDGGYEVEIPLPGFRPEDVEVTYQDDVIAVNAKGERRSFSRSFTVPDDVDPDKIEAKVADGMLVLKLTRRPEAQPRRIAVS